MIASALTGISRSDRRIGQIAIGLLLLQPIAAYVLTVVGLISGGVGIIPFDPVPLAVLILSLALFFYLRVHIGRAWLFRLYPNWVSKWPHVRIFALSFAGLILWYVLNITILSGNVALYRLGYSELFFFTMLEVYTLSQKANAERDR